MDDYSETDILLDIIDRLRNELRSSEADVFYLTQKVKELEQDAR